MTKDAVANKARSPSNISVFKTFALAEAARGCTIAERIAIP